MKRDVQDYFISMQKQMNDMNKILEKVNKEISEGKVSDEQRSNFESYYNTVRSNYERVAYIIHLLNQPPKFIQKLRENKIKKEQEKRLKEFENSNLEFIENENETAVKYADDLLEDITIDEEEVQRNGI